MQRPRPRLELDTPATGLAAKLCDERGQRRCHQAFDVVPMWCAVHTAVRRWRCTRDAHARSLNTHSDVGKLVKAAAPPRLMATLSYLNPARGRRAWCEKRIATAAVRSAGTHALAASSSPAWLPRNTVRPLIQMRVLYLRRAEVICGSGGEKGSGRKQLHPARRAHWWRALVALLVQPVWRGGVTRLGARSSARWRVSGAAAGGHASRHAAARTRRRGISACSADRMTLPHPPWTWHPRFARRPPPRPTGAYAWGAWRGCCASASAARPAQPQAR